ncbi:hypothetical protein DY000_02059596 [Brassica cretica]|nr:hypothetical protein DY000_02059596 [Brassica cretica]
MDWSRRLLNNDLASLAAVRQLELWCVLVAKRGSTFGSRRRPAARTLTDGVVNQRIRKVTAKELGIILECARGCCYCGSFEFMGLKRQLFLSCRMSLLSFG